jgi:hypothetical protein
MTFELQNDSAAAGVSGIFDDVLLQLNGARETLFNDEQLAPSQSVTDALDVFENPFVDGVLTLVFRPIGLPSQQYRFAFDSAVDPPVFFEYTAYDPGTPVPEPSWIILLAIGAAALFRRRYLPHSRGKPWREHSSTQGPPVSD